MSNEADVQARIMLAIGSDPAVRLFRNNTGQAWQGQRSEALERVLARFLKPGQGVRVLLNPRPVNFGLCVGGSDLIGWRSVQVGPQHVGQRLARFLALEVKDTGTATTDQLRFIARVLADGGAGGVVRGPDEAREVLTEP